MTNGKDVITEREHFRIQLLDPIHGEMTISMVDGKRVYPNNTEINIEDIGPGGLRFTSTLQFPITSRVILRFETEISGRFFHLHGFIVWKEPCKDQEETFRYGVKFTINDEKRKEVVVSLNKLAARMKRQQTAT